MEHTLKLIRILANHQSECDGDELFLKVRGKKVWPLKQRYQRISDPELDINVELKVKILEEKMELQLWEYDNLFFSHRLGKFSMLVNETGGPFRTDLVRENDEYTNYSIEWEVE